MDIYAKICRIEILIYIFSIWFWICFEFSSQQTENIYSLGKNKNAWQSIEIFSLNFVRRWSLWIIHHAPICSVRTFFWWKLTSITDLQMGHLILMMPSTAVGSASNNLLFLQHGHATCTSCTHFASRKRPVKRECQTDRWLYSSIIPLHISSVTIILM